MSPEHLQNDQHGTAHVAVDSTLSSGFAATRRTFDPYGNPMGTAQSVWPNDRGFLNMPHNPITGLTGIGAANTTPPPAPSSPSTP